METGPSPLDPDRLDELLSAELDGELAAAALDLGMSVDEATARLRATPGTADRRSALAAARDLLTEPPPIDELVATRLRAGALGAPTTAAATPPARSRAGRGAKLWWLRAGSIAAAAAVIVAVAVTLGDHHTTSKTASGTPAAASASGAVPETPPSTTSAAAPDLGSYTDAGTLARAVVARNRNSGSSNAPTQPQFRTIQPTVAPGKSSEIPSTSTSMGKALGRSAAATSPVAATPAGGCSAPPGVAVGATLQLRATATLSGDKVIVLLFATKNEHVVVIEDLHCTLVNLQTFG